MNENRDYRRIAAAIDYIATHYREQPDLATVARAVHLSPHHFNRLFRRWAGITPKQFLKIVTLGAAKRSLDAERNVFDAALESGLSGPGRLHDLFVTIEAMTPGEFRTGGRGLQIAWGWNESPFGDCLIAMTSRGICHLGFYDSGVAAARRELEELWPAAELVRDQPGTAAFAARVFKPRSAAGGALPLHLGGTNFQLQVWRALLQIPAGETQSYGALAAEIGSPSAARAVGSAVGANPVAYLIPCHRVLRRGGGIGGYRWGVSRKRAMLALESLQFPAVGRSQGRIAWLEPNPGP
jgi:AraC family transcriptional regulator of adaptative response/methylated-DNA-[protein]-cysteine methyltransferase